MNTYACATATWDFPPALWGRDQTQAPVEAHTQTPVIDEEAAIIARVLNGEGEAYGELVERHSRAVYNLAYRYLGNVDDAEDAAQEVFHRPFRSWLLTVAANHCIDRLRRRTPRTIPDGEDLLTALPASDDPVGSVLDRERRREVQRMVQALPEVYRTVVILRYWHDMSCEEIAEVLAISIGAVKTRLHRARQALLKDFGADGMAA